MNFPLFFFNDDGGMFIHNNLQDIMIIYLESVGVELLTPQ